MIIGESGVAEWLAILRGGVAFNIRAARSLSEGRRAGGRSGTHIGSCASLAEVAAFAFAVRAVIRLIGFHAPPEASLGGAVAVM